MQSQLKKDIRILWFKVILTWIGFAFCMFAARDYFILYFYGSVSEGVTKGDSTYLVFTLAWASATAITFNLNANLYIKELKEKSLEYEKKEDS